MRGTIGIAAAAAAVLIGMSLATAAEQTSSGVTVLRGNPVTSDGRAIGVGTGAPDTATPNAANAFGQTGNVNARATGSSNAGGEIANGLGR